MRAFIAIPLPEALRVDLFQQTAGLRKRFHKARWIPPENMHITLKFLGEIDTVQSSEIGNLLAEVADGQERFTVSLTGFGCFPPRGRPRVLYIGMDQQSRLRLIADSLEKKLSCLGFPVEGRFKSHVTLARIKDSVDPGQLFRDVNQIELSGQFDVNRICLVKSILTPSGARYEIVAQGLFDC